MNLKRHWKQVLFWVLFCLGTGGLASWLTRKGLRSFDALRRPPLTPPRIVFPAVWSLLLILIGWGYARVRILAPDSAAKERASLAFSVQMTFFFCWMIWFFGLGWYGFAAVWLGGLIAAVGAMIAVYRGISRLAARLQLPYLIWCCFALYLNLGVWLLNRA